MARPSRIRRDRPSGIEIAQKAKAIQLDRKRSVSEKKDGKVVTFTGADLLSIVPKDMSTGVSAITFLDSLALGQVIGLLENELEGDETNLPAGTSNLLIANVNYEWKCYAERDGEVVAEAVNVSVEQSPGVKGEDLHPPPRFDPQGWCIYYEFWYCPGTMWDFSCKWSKLRICW